MLLVLLLLIWLLQILRHKHLLILLSWNNVYWLLRKSRCHNSLWNSYLIRNKNWGSIHIWDILGVLLKLGMLLLLLLLHVLKLLGLTWVLVELISSLLRVIDYRWLVWRLWFAFFIKFRICFLLELQFLLRLTLCSRKTLCCSWFR